MGQVVGGEGYRVRQGPCDGTLPLLRMRQGQIAEAFNGKVLDNCVENPMSGVRYNADNGSDFQRAPEASEFVAMQEPIGRCRGAQSSVRAHVG